MVPECQEPEEGRLWKVKRAPCFVTCPRMKFEGVLTVRHPRPSLRCQIAQQRLGEVEVLRGLSCVSGEDIRQ